MPASLLLLASIGGLPLPADAPELVHRRRIAAGVRDTLVAAEYLGLVPVQLSSASVLFRQHRPPSLAPGQVLAQARHLFEAFHAWVGDFQTLCPCQCTACRAVPGLTLQVLAHAEPLVVASARRSAGRAAAALPALLASGVPIPECVLLTNDLLGPNQRAAAWASARCGQVDKIGYVYLPLRDAAEVPAWGRVGKEPLSRLLWSTSLPDLSNHLTLNLLTDESPLATCAGFAAGTAHPTHLRAGAAGWAPVGYGS